MTTLDKIFQMEELFEQKSFKNISYIEVNIYEQIGECLKNILLAMN